MKTRDPRKKKELDKKLTHYDAGDHPRTFHKGWKRKTRRVEKSYRTKVRTELRKLGELEDVEPDIESIHRKQLSKWGVISLEEKLNEKERVTYRSFARKILNNTAITIDERKRRLVKLIEHLLVERSKEATIASHKILDSLENYQTLWQRDFLTEQRELLRKLAHKVDRND